MLSARTCIVVILIAGSAALNFVQWVVTPSERAKVDANYAGLAGAQSKPDTGTFAPNYPAQPTVVNAKAESAPAAAAQVNAPAPQPAQAAQAPQPAVTTGAPSNTPVQNVTLSATAQPSPEIKQPVAAEPAQPQPAVQQAKASCDVSACARRYSSFRSDDCTYQPMDGPRRLCAARPMEASAQPQAQPQRAPQELRARKPSRDDELRDVERAVRQMTDDDLDAPPAPRRRVYLFP